MRTTTVVEVEVAGRLPGYGYGFVAVQIHLLVLHGFPEPFDEDVVAPATLAVHADLPSSTVKRASD